MSITSMVGGRRGGGSRRGGKSRRWRSSHGDGATHAPVVREPVTLPSVMSVSEFAEKIDTNGIEIIRELMKIGIMANLNQQIDYDTAAKVADRAGLGNQRAGVRSHSRRRRFRESAA